MAKPDLNKLRQEIDSRKQERNIAPSSLGESVGGMTPRDTFLNGLLTSLKSGHDTASTNLIKIVENQVAIKNKETVKHRINENPVEREPARIPIQPSKVDMSPEREEQMYTDLNTKKNQTLAESIAPFVGGGKQKQQYPSPTSGAVPPSQLNEGYLVENVKKIVDNYLIDNFGIVVEEAIKGTILEMYAAERIKEVLTENKEMIKGIIIEVFKEISEKNKAKKAQL